MDAAHNAFLAAKKREKHWGNKAHQERGKAFQEWIRNQGADYDRALFAWAKGAEEENPPDEIEENGAGLLRPLASIAEKAKFWTKLWKRDKGNKELIARTLWVVRRAALQYRKTAGELSQEHIERGYRELPDRTGKGIEMLPPRACKELPREGRRELLLLHCEVEDKLALPWQVLPAITCLVPMPGGGKQETDRSPR